jgi:hypothetical protein
MEQSPKPKLRPKLRLSYDDLKKIERVVEAEAKGEGVEGRNAIRGVIFNRLMSKRFPNTVDKVLSPREFEPVGTYGSVDKIPVSEDVLNERLTEMADYIQLGEDASKGSTFFLNKKLAKKRKTDFGGKDGMTIGNHTFYKSYEGQEPVEDINFSHNIEVYYKGYDQGGFVDSLMDTITSPLTGEYRKEKPLSVKAADTAVSLTTPIDSIVEIQEELKKDKPDYLKIGMLGGVEAISLVGPGIAPAARTMIRKGADMASQTDNIIDVTSSIPKVKTKKDFSNFNFNQLNLSSDEIEKLADVNKRFLSSGGKSKAIQEAEKKVQDTIDAKIPLIEKALADALTTNKGVVTLEDYKNAVEATINYEDLKSAATDIANQQGLLNKMGASIGFDMAFDDAVDAAVETFPSISRGETNDLLIDLLNGGYQDDLVDWATTENAIRKSYDKYLTSKKQINPTRQVSNAEYDARVSALDSAEDDKTWQTNAEALVKDMRETSPTIRTPELEESAQALRDGKITREQHLKNINTYKPVESWDALPREPSNKATVFSLKPDQREKGRFILPADTTEALGVTQSGLKVGDRFNGRLDIPAYQRFDTWIVAGTSNAEKGVTHYAKAIHYKGVGDKPVRFAASQKTGEKIGTGEMGKTGYATVSGEIKDLDADAIREKAAALLNDPEWTQVGFDPRRQSSFYVRGADNRHVPVREADEVIQIGPLVLAKNAKLDKDYAGYAEGGVAMDEQMDAVFKSSRTEIDPVSGNEVPPGSLPEEVRDDIPAMLSEGEYVVPADVLRFYGVKFFEDLRAQAKMGLAEMEANGRIGGEPIEEETGDVGISDEDLMVIMAQAPQEEQAVGAANGGLMGFQAGGLNYPAYIQQPDLTQFGMAGPDFQGGLEYRTYVNASGMEITIPFFDGEPMGMIPPGYSLKGEVAQQEEAPQVSQDEGEPVRAKTPAPEEFDIDAIPTEKLEETARGMSTMTNIASGIASMAGLPVAALVNTTGVARYNDVLDRLQAEDPEAFEKSGLEKKGSIFGGESSLYENLADTDGDGKKSFGDTWLGDFLGFDGEAGIKEGNPGLRDSIAGARRTDDDDDSSPVPTATSTPSETPENEPSGSSVQAAAESYSDLAEAEDKDYGLI